MKNKSIELESIAQLLVLGYFESAKNNQSLLKSIFPGVDDQIIRKEEAGLTAFEFSIALMMVFDRAITTQIIQSFKKAFCESLAESGYFSSADSCKDFLSTRIEMYNEAFSNEKEPGPVYWLSKRICEVCGDLKVSNAVRVAEGFTKRINADTKFLKSLAD